MSNIPANPPNSFKLLIEKLSQMHLYTLDVATGTRTTYYGYIQFTYEYLKLTANYLDIGVPSYHLENKNLISFDFDAQVHTIKIYDCHHPLTKYDIDDLEDIEALETLLLGYESFVGTTLGDIPFDCISNYKAVWDDYIKAMKRSG